MNESHSISKAKWIKDLDLVLVKISQRVTNEWLAVTALRSLCNVFRRVLIHRDWLNCTQRPRELTATCRRRRAAHPRRTLPRLQIGLTWNGTARNPALALVHDNFILDNIMLSKHEKYTIPLQSTVIDSNNDQWHTIKVIENIEGAMKWFGKSRGRKVL